MVFIVVIERSSFLLIKFEFFSENYCLLPSLSIFVTVSFLVLEFGV